MTAAVNLPGADNPAVISFAQRTLQTIRALPDVQAAGVTTLIPFSGDINYNVILAEGHVMRPGESLTAPSTVTVSPGYFEAIGARLVAGRAFDDRDTATSPKVVVIDDRLARQFWNGQEAVGRRLYRPSDPKDVTKITKDTEFYNVVGVIKEMQLMDPRGDYTPVGVAYFPLDQNPSRGMRRPVVPDFSGWNWVPNTRPRSTAAANGAPCVVTAAAAAAGAANEWVK